MELIVSFVALTVSLLTNVYLIKKLTSIEVNVHIPEQKVEFFWPPFESTEKTEPELEPKPVKDDQSRHAWKNQKGIPLNETKRSPNHGSKPPTAGPLERPAGFAR